MKDTLINRIKSYLKSQGKTLEIHDLYSAFPEEKRTTIRGRINENVNNGITRVSRGLYISSDVIIEHADIMKRLDSLKESGMQYDFIFLDIPYKSTGQRGGNRKIAKFNTISVSEFQELLDKSKDILTDDGTIQFMITSGKSSKREVDKYINCFNNAGYIQLKRGAYTKMNANGTKCNIGKYLLPPEEIIIYAKKELDVSNWTVDFAEVRVLDYPTQKPVSLVEKLLIQATKIGDWILDPFGGSGAMLKACRKLKRKCHIMDISAKSIYEYILPIMTEPC